MFDLLGLLNTTYKGIAMDMVAWFAEMPDGAAWNVVSDYCIDDERKENDTFSFSIILNHDTYENISSYISHVAPKDIKSSRKSSEGLVAYLKCPVTFSVTYVVSKKSKLLRDYIDDKNMKDFIPNVRKFISGIASADPDKAPYFKEVDARFHSFYKDLNQKNPNYKLSRQIHLVAAFAAMVFRCLEVSVKPSHIRWISDRDAMFDRHNGIAFDLGYIYFLLERNSIQSTNKMILPPKFTFVLPYMDGERSFSEFIRLPDYLAGTLADISLSQMRFSHEKFIHVFTGALIGSKNNTIIEVLSNNEVMTTRRIYYGENCMRSINPTCPTVG